MPTLTDSQITDLANGCLKKLGKGRYTQLVQNLREYPVMGTMMRRDRVVFGDGTGIRRNLMVNSTRTARQVGLFQDDVVDVSSHGTYIEVPWVHTTVSMGWDRREIDMCSGESAIFDLMSMRYTNMYLDLAELAEELFWNKPASASNTLDPWGVPYWIVKPGSGEEGFVGGDPYVGSGAGGVLTGTYPKWKNYGADYTNVSDLDLLKKMRTGYRKVKFKSIPRERGRDHTDGMGTQHIYVNDDTIMEMEDILRGQNDNLGRDLAKYQNATTFMQKDVEVAETLNSDTSDPVYFLDTRYFRIGFLEGNYLRETDALRAPNQHNAWAKHCDLSWCIYCFDRRRQAVFAKI